MFDKDIQTSIELGVDLMKDIVAAGYSFLKEKGRERDFFGTATKKYVGGLLERNSSIKVLTMREPQPLEKLYVRANILKDKITAELGLSAEELEKFHDFDRRAFGKIAETVDGELIVNQLKRFIVLGKPGAGKTTYLRYLTLMMLQPLSQIERRKLPIFVTLREWADKKKPLMDFIVEQFSICGFDEARPFVERMLANGDCIVLFDGLDEVSQEANQSGIIQEIKDFSDKYGENQFVISCRVAAYNRWFDRFTDVEMADFNNAQIEAFIRNWFHGQPKVGQECWMRLKNIQPLKELASVPLLLTLLCIAYNKEHGFPSNRANLYEKAIKLLLGKWDKQKLVRRDEVYHHLTTPQKIEMFSRIAYGYFLENQSVFKQQTLSRQIELYIRRLKKDESGEHEPDGDSILEAIEAQHGIVIQLTEGIYTFMHLTFQEYFAARHIVNYSSQGTLEYLVNDHLFDDNWLEVFLSVASMLECADELLLLIWRKNNELLPLPELSLLMLSEEESLLPQEHKLNVVVKKSTSVYITRDFARPFSITRDFALILAREFTRTHYLRDRARDLSLTIAFAISTNRNRSLSEFKVDSGINILTLEIIKKITNYLKGNVCIAKCLNAATFVSPPIREKILNEMLMPRKEGE